MAEVTTDHETIRNAKARGGKPAAVDRTLQGDDVGIIRIITGVLAIFAARLLSGRPPMIFEDGQQRRDCVHVLPMRSGRGTTASW